MEPDRATSNPDLLIVLFLIMPPPRTTGCACVGLITFPNLKGAEQ